MVLTRLKERSRPAGSLATSTHSWWLLAVLSTFIATVQDHTLFTPLNLSGFLFSFHLPLIRTRVYYSEGEGPCLALEHTILSGEVQQLE